jgi:hypothetical protein
MCAKTRRTCVTREITSHFSEGSDWTPGKVELGAEMKGGEGLSFPQPADNMEPPFYFGIDIRSENELKLGKFPKASDVLIDTSDMFQHITYYTM